MTVSITKIRRAAPTVLTWGSNTAWDYLSYFEKDPIAQFQKTVAQVQKTVSDQYGTWTVRHSQKLAHELVGVTLNEPEKAMLIDCLTGGHLTDLNSTLPPEVEALVIPDVGLAATRSWPEWALYFDLVASKFIDRRANKEKDELIDRLEQFTEKKFEPLAVYLATIAARFIEKRSKQFSPSTFVLAEISKTIVAASSRQLATSTGIDRNNQATWYINGKYLPTVAHDAFATLSAIPDLNAPNT